MKPKALLFDFYGTIVEEADQYVDRVCNIISQNIEVQMSGIEMWGYWYNTHMLMCNGAFGDSFRSQKEIAKSSLQVLLNKVNCSLDIEELIKIIYQFWESPKILKGSKEVLSRCDRPLCVVSNIDNKEIYAALEMHDLHFQHVITSELCKAYKPRKEVFGKSLELLNLAPEEVLYVGDSYLIDVIGAKSAGIPVMWLNRRDKKVSTGEILPDNVIRDLNELFVFIDGL